MKNVVKNSGELVPFDERKILESLKRAGTNTNTIDLVLHEVKNAIYNGISTKKIYSLTHKYLKQFSQLESSRYKLKQSIMSLGPSGYPFEKLVGEILKVMGFEVQVGIQMQGKCVQHEVDVFAEKGNQQFIVECKFHNRQGYKSDVKVPLYIDSRFRDLKNSIDPTSGKTMNGWIVTNTRFTIDAIKYAECAGMKIMSWDYPKNQSLKGIITKLNLHPITSLTNLNKREKEELLANDIIICRNALERPQVVSEVIKDDKKRRKVFKQIELMCGV
ncbi:MAG: restriction endonuclease [Cyclobacteriaceae bacterium]